MRLCFAQVTSQVAAHRVEYVARASCDCATTVHARQKQLAAIRNTRSRDLRFGIHPAMTRHVFCCHIVATGHICAFKGRENMRKITHKSKKEQLMRNHRLYLCSLHGNFFAFWCSRMSLNKSAVAMSCQRKSDKTPRSIYLGDTDTFCKTDKTDKTRQNSFMSV